MKKVIEYAEKSNYTLVNTRKKGQLYEKENLVSDHNHMCDLGLLLQHFFAESDTHRNGYY